MNDSWQIFVIIFQDTLQIVISVMHFYWVVYFPHYWLYELLGVPPEKGTGLGIIQKISVLT